MNGLALCAGVGGIDIALRVLFDNYKTVCYVERSAYAAAVILARMEEKTLDKAPIWDDIATFDGGEWRGLVDIISAGFPCQPFSVAGKRRGIADDRWLWPHVSQTIRVVQPEYVFIENTPGLVQNGLRYVFRDLRNMGYGVQAGLFSAAEVGAPHRRQRLFVLAYSHGSGLWVQSRRRRRQEGAEAPVIDHLGNVADAYRERCEGEHTLLQPGGPQQDSVEATGGCVGDKDVADASSTRCARQQTLQPEERPWPPTLWPPGRESLGRRDWKWPKGIEPAIRRVATRTADSLVRSDTLSCIGNSVVPLVAAYAFGTLALAVARKVKDHPD